MMNQSAQILNPSFKADTQDANQNKITQKAVAKNAIKEQLLEKHDQKRASVEADLSSTNLEGKSGLRGANLPDGWNNLYDTKGSLVQKVHVMNGLFEGVSEVYLQGKLRRREYYKNDLLDGAALFYDDQGRITMKVSYRSGERNGVTEVYKKSRLTAACSFVNNSLEGPVIAFNEEGGMKSKLLYKNGVREGPGVIYGKDGGVLATIEYRNDLKHGYWKQFYPSGELNKLEYYQDDLREGKVVSFYPNGARRSEAEYKGGKITLAEVHYDIDGKMINTKP